jgi:hypothetical protein
LYNGADGFLSVLLRSLSLVCAFDVQLSWWQKRLGSLSELLRILVRPKIDIDCMQAEEIVSLIARICAGKPPFTQIRARSSRTRLLKCINYHGTQVWMA